MLIEIKLRKIQDNTYRSFQKRVASPTLECCYSCPSMCTDARERERQQQRRNFHFSLSSIEQTRRKKVLFGQYSQMLDDRSSHIRLKREKSQSSSFQCVHDIMVMYFKY